MNMSDIKDGNGLTIGLVKSTNIMAFKEQFGEEYFEKFNKFAKENFELIFWAMISNEDFDEVLNVYEKSLEKVEYKWWINAEYAKVSKYIGKMFFITFEGRFVDNPVMFIQIGNDKFTFINVKTGNRSTDDMSKITKVELAS